MRQIAKAIAKIDDEIKTLENLRDRLPEGTDAIGTINAEIDLLGRVRDRMKAALETKPKATNDGKKRDRTPKNNRTTAAATTEQK